MGEYYRITVVAMATSCASGINRFRAQEFLMQEKVCLRCLLLCIFISIFPFNILKKNIPKPQIIFCCCSCWLICQKLQAGRGIWKSLLLIFQFTAFDQWGLSACLLCAALAMIGRKKMWMHEFCNCPFTSTDPYKTTQTRHFTVPDFTCFDPRRRVFLCFCLRGCVYAHGYPHC